MSKPGRRRVPAAPKKRRSIWPLIIVGAVMVSVLIAIAIAAEPEAESGSRDPAIVAEGMTLFAANCAMCHGADLLGTADGPPLLHPYYAPNHHADEAFQRAVAFGVMAHHWSFGDMPPRPNLTREDVAKIIAFVRTEQEAAGIYRDTTHGMSTHTE